MFCWSQLFSRGIHNFSRYVQDYSSWAEEFPEVAKVSLLDVSLMRGSPQW